MIQEIPVFVVCSLDRPDTIVHSNHNCGRFEVMGVFTEVESARAYAANYKDTHNIIIYTSVLNPVTYGVHPT